LHPFAELDDTDTILIRSDVEATDDAIDEPLQQSERLDGRVLDDASGGIDQESDVSVLTSCET